MISPYANDGDRPEQLDDEGRSNIDEPEMDTAAMVSSTPSIDSGNSTPGLYELQGELLRPSRELAEPKSEFVAPQNLSVAEASHPSPSPLGVQSNKRKSRPDFDPSAGDIDNPPKRTQLDRQQDDRRPSGHVEIPRHSTNAAQTKSRAPPSLRSLRRSHKEEPRTLEDPTIPMILPAQKVFPIQVGDRLFRLSGASISSDAPSYFSQFFGDQLRRSNGAEEIRTLYIDRDPATFEDISLHLQGYHIEPRDSEHFVKLFADCQFFSLPKLKEQICSAGIYVRVGGTEFRIPRDLFDSPGNSPNYFTLGFATFFTSSEEAFPGLSQRALLRPPPIMPPSVPNKSSRTFAELIHILKGYPIEIRNKQHRAELLQDARYFHFKGLEQRLVANHISYNPLRTCHEIVIGLDDLQRPGLSIAELPSHKLGSKLRVYEASNPQKWVHYKRPYVDEEAYVLVLETGVFERTTIFLLAAPADTSSERVSYIVLSKPTMSRLWKLMDGFQFTGAFSPIPPHSEVGLRVEIEADAAITLNGKEWDLKKSDKSQHEIWIVTRSQWRLRVNDKPDVKGGIEIVWQAVKIDAVSKEWERNAARGFLT